MGIRWTTTEREWGDVGGSDGISTEALAAALRLAKRLSRIEVCLEGVRKDDRRVAVG